MINYAGSTDAVLVKYRSVNFSVLKHSLVLFDYFNGSSGLGNSGLTKRGGETRGEANNDNISTDSARLARWLRTSFRDGS